MSPILLQRLDTNLLYRHFPKLFDTPYEKGGLGFIIVVILLFRSIFQQRPKKVGYLILVCCLLGTYPATGTWPPSRLTRLFLGRLLGWL